MKSLAASTNAVSTGREEGKEEEAYLLPRSSPSFEGSKASSSVLRGPAQNIRGQHKYRESGEGPRTSSTGSVFLYGNLPPIVINAITPKLHTSAFKPYPFPLAMPSTTPSSGYISGAE